MAFVALEATSALAFTTRPFSVREFKTREIKFRTHSDKEDETERRSSARERRAAREREDAEARREERDAEERERKARERELKKQLEENERQQKELQKARDRELAEEWKVYLQELKASNLELRAAIKVAKEEKSRAELSCGMVFPDGRHCPNRALEGQWFCAEHEEPPLPKADRSESPEKELADTEKEGQDARRHDLQDEKRRENVRKRPRPKCGKEQHLDRDGDSSLTRWVTGVLIGLGIFFVWRMIIIYRTMK